MLTARRVWQRALDGLLALVTWGAAAGLVLYFYDWVNRWYVIVGVVLALVVGTPIVEGMARAHRAATASLTAAELAAADLKALPLPAPREPIADVDGWLPLGRQTA